MKNLYKSVILILTSIIPIYSLAQLTDDELLLAVKNNEVSKIDNFYKNKHNDPNKLLGKQKIPLLHFAAALNKSKVVEILIDAGADFNIIYQKDSPLMNAIYYNHPNIVELLLSKGVDVNFKDPEGRTAAIKAVKYDKPELLKLLIRNKVDLSIKDNKSKSAINYAFDLQNIECYDYLSKIEGNNYDSIPFPDYFDGPYVFWEGKSKLKVSYLFNDKNKCYKIDSLLTYKKGKTVLTRKEQSFEIPIRKVKNNTSPPFEFSNVEKIMAIGDLHGEFDTFQKFLLKNKIIDKDYNWIFGKGHLVLIGDIFDRGSKVNECFWLLYKLESEAEKQGGKVHFVLGNHEIMQLSGDKRYLAKKYLNLCNRLRINYTDFYGKDTEIGKWLRTRNSVIKINENIFVHGGLSPELVKNKIALKTINTSIRTIINRKNHEPINVVEDFLLSNLGPLWYRGYIRLDNNFYRSNNIEYNINQEKVDNIIKFYSADAIIFANTHVKEITPFFNFKIYGIDIPFAESSAELQGLYIEGNHYYKALLDGTKKLVH